jgi:pimeloyl-ACP methyl ester carboxylesterase
VEAFTIGFRGVQLLQAHYLRCRRTPTPPEPPKVKLPVMFHGLNDTALNSDGCRGPEPAGEGLTLVTVPGAGHFVQQDAAELVTNTMRWWLTMHSGR